MHYIPPPRGITDSTGTFHAGVVPRVHREVGPVSYAGGGFLVDLSSIYSSIVFASVGRVFITATGNQDESEVVSIRAAAPDDYASAKLRLVVSRPPDHTHLYEKTNTPTGVNSADSPLGAGTHTHPQTFTGTQSGVPTATALSQTGSIGRDLSGNTYEILVWGIPK